MEQNSQPPTSANFPVAPSTPLDAVVCHYCLTNQSNFWKRHKSSGNILCSECYKIDKERAPGRTPSPTVTNVASVNIVTTPATSITANLATSTTANLATPTTANLATPTTANLATPTTANLATPTTTTLGTPTTATLATPTTAILATPTTATATLTTPTTATLATPTATLETPTTKTATLVAPTTKTATLEAPITKTSTLVAPTTKTATLVAPTTKTAALATSTRKTATLATPTTATLATSTTLAKKTPETTTPATATTKPPSNVPAEKSTRDETKKRVRKPKTFADGSHAGSPELGSFDSKWSQSSVKGPASGPADDVVVDSKAKCDEIKLEIQVIKSDAAQVSRKKSTVTSKPEAERRRPRANLDVIADSLTNSGSVAEDGVAVDNIFKRVAKSLVQNEASKQSLGPTKVENPPPKKMAKTKVPSKTTAKLESPLKRKTLAKRKVATAETSTTTTKVNSSASPDEPQPKKARAKLKPRNDLQRLQKRRKEQQRRQIRKRPTPRKKASAPEPSKGVETEPGKEVTVTETVAQTKKIRRPQRVAADEREESRRSTAVQSASATSLSSNNTIEEKETPTTNRPAPEEEGRKARSEARAATVTNAVAGKRKNNNGKGGGGRSKVGRRHLFFKQRGSVTRGPRRFSSVVTPNVVYFRNQFWQKGDIVSVVDEDDEQVYYAQIRGFVQDQFCDKGVVLTWLLPTRPWGEIGGIPPGILHPGFHPDAFVAGPEEDLPRRMECVEFVCRAPSDYFRLPLGTDGDAPFPTANAHPDSAFESRRRELGFVWYGDEDQPEIAEIPDRTEQFLGVE